MNMNFETLSVEPNGHRVRTKIKAMVTRLRDESYISAVQGPFDCRYCGSQPELLMLAGDVVRAKEPCPYPGGITTEITISVPSGKILVTDDLRPVYDCERGPFITLNSSLGQARLVEAMAAIGCAYGPVGDGDLGLYRTGPDSYIIARPDYDRDGEPSLPEDTLLAGIVTGLLAYSIADFEDWKARGGDPERLDWNWTDTVVEVNPGTYRFVHHSEAHGFNGDSAGTVVFAHVERIG